MPQPGLPVTIAASASAERDEASVLTGTTGAIETLDPNWLTPTSGMAELFVLSPRQGRAS